MSHDPPTPVTRAEARARQEGFEQSCDPGVGRLLAVLAGGVPTGGRILELGTGVGYGTAWIVEGLGTRSDVEVVSVEIDAARHAGVAAEHWPGSVKLVRCDALDLFDELGKFSLIFADAQGGKWEGLDRTIAALAPAGVLIVDDMRRPTVEIAPDQAARTDGVRATLLADPRLLTVELDWASGVILARRRVGVITDRAASSADGRLASDGVVILTRFVPGDAPTLVDADDDPEHRRRFDIPRDYVPSVTHSENVIARWERAYGLRQQFTLAVRSVATGELLGGCELRPLEGPTANLSYWTYPGHRRRGVATRAVALACALARNAHGFRRLEVLTDSDNIASRRVATHNGFVEVGEREGQILHVIDLGPEADAG